MEPWREQQDLTRKLFLANQQDVPEGARVGCAGDKATHTGCGDCGASNDSHARALLQFADARNSEVDVRGILSGAPNEAEHL